MGFIIFFFERQMVLHVNFFVKKDIISIFKFFYSVKEKH